MVRASLQFGVLLALVAFAAEGQVRLGDVRPGEVLRLPLAEVVPLSRLRVEIDGRPTEVDLALDGRFLLVTLPEGLQGRAHDIVVLRRQPDADVELGLWSFGTPSGQVETSAAGRVEIERRAGRAGGEYRFAGNGRLGFNLDDGRLRAGVGFVQTGTSRRKLTTEVSDYFIETEQALLGQDFVARLGTQSLPADTLLVEDGTWRGASLRLSDPSGRADVMGFVLQPGEASGRQNLSGLGDRDARLAGVAGHAFPIRGAGLRADVAAFDGRADLGGTAGDARGASLRLSGPIGADWGDYALDFGQTVTRPDGGGEQRGAAWAAELGFGLLPQGDGRSLELRLSAEARDADFFSPLNPDLIADESRQKAELLFQSDQWQWALSGETARSNIADDAARATDRFNSYALDVTYSPYVFTGGFLQGVTFYGSLASEDQRRIYTPSGGASAQDFRLQSLSFGMDRFQPDHAWAVGIKLDQLTDLSGAGVSERRERLEASYAFTPDDLRTFTLRAEGGRAVKTASTQRDVTLEMSYAFPILSDVWTGYVELGNIWVEDDAAKSGRYAGLEVKRALPRGLAVLLRADYGAGVEASDLTPGAGWTFGIGLRQDFGPGLK